MDRTCADCAKPITRQSKSGLCRTCSLKRRNSDPEFQAKRLARVKQVFALRPELVQARRQFMTALNKTDKARKRAGEQARRIGLGAIGQACLTPECWKRGAKTLEEKRLGHIPPELRDEYRYLVNKKRCTAKEATAIILAQHEKNMADFRKSLEAA